MRGRDVITSDDCWWGRLPCEIDFSKVNVFGILAREEEKKKKKAEFRTRIKRKRAERIAKFKNTFSIKRKLKKIASTVWYLFEEI